MDRGSQRARSGAWDSQGAWLWGSPLWAWRSVGGWSGQELLGFRTGSLNPGGFGTTQAGPSPMANQRTLCFPGLGRARRHLEKQPRRDLEGGQDVPASSARASRQRPSGEKENGDGKADVLMPPPRLGAHSWEGRHGTARDTGAGRGPALETPCVLLSVLTTEVRAHPSQMVLAAAVGQWHLGTRYLFVLIGSGPDHHESVW